MPHNNRHYHRSKPLVQRPPIESLGNPAVLSLPIDVIGLNAETFTLLKNAGFSTLYDIASRSERDFYRIQTFSKRNLFEVKNKMAAKGLSILQPPKTDDSSGMPAEKSNKNSNNLNTIRSDNGRNNKRNDSITDNRKFQQSSRELSKEPRKQNVLLPINEWRKVNKNGKWGFNNGLKTIIEPVYDEVFLFKDGLACVEKDDLFGFIDENGEIIIPITYECALSFSEGLACVQIKDKCGYINKENVLVIPCIFDAATAFEGGFAKVKQDGKWCTIDVGGNIIYRM